MAKKAASSRSKGGPAAREDSYFYERILAPTSTSGIVTQARTDLRAMPIYIR